MCLFLCKLLLVFLILGALHKQIEGRKKSRHESHGEKFVQHHTHHKTGKRTHVRSELDHVLTGKEANYRRSMKRENVTAEKDSALLTRQAEDILMDEIRGSDQAANRAEISFDIPKQLEYLKSSMKAGDITDIDTENMISLNEQKGTYLPASEVTGNVRGTPTKKLLTEQFKNISGLPDFMLKKHVPRPGKGKAVSLVEKVADSLQPGVGALSGIKQLLEESKVEQSLKKHLDSMNTNFISNIPNPPVPNEPSVVETSNSAESLNAVNVASEPALNPGYMTPISPDQVYDEAISPPEQLLDDLSTGKFKHPLSDNALEKMSDWNANKEFLADNGFMAQDPGILSPKLSRVSSEFMPVHDVYLHQKPIRPTQIMSKDSLELLKNDPEILGRNQELLNSQQFHSLSDLDSIGPPIYPAKIVHLPHRPKHVFLPSKHIVTHLKGAEYHQDNDEGIVWHNHNTEDYMNEDGEISEQLYHPHHTVHSARCSYKPCLNGGKCTALIDKYVCTCREGFYGINCERRSFCYPNPCRHGTCSSNTDGFVCTCEPGYQGKRCEERDKCHPNPCMHGGTCTSTFSGIYCSCLLGFKGRYCESEAKCSPINPCLNGGRCQEMPSTYICICKNGFAGKNCDAILKPTSLPPTIDMKPVPPQAIPPPHGQPPFLLEELNSLNDGPLEEHPVPETSFDAVPLDDHHGHQVYEHHDEHHFPDIFDDHYDDGHNDIHHNHGESHLAISSSPAVIIHLGDRTKESKKDKKKDEGKGKGRKNPPTSFKQDDRYVTHLVAAAPVKGKPVDDDKKPENDKQPPLEKPTAKQDKPKGRIPTAQTLMRLQNPKDLRLDDNRVYTDMTGLLAQGALNQLPANVNGGTPYGAQLYARPAVKQVVFKEERPKQAKVRNMKKKPKANPKQMEKPRVIWVGQGQNQKATNQASQSKSSLKKPHVICPNFCKQFCDKWCVKIGCCKTTEVKGPTAADDILPAKAKIAIDKKAKKIVSKNRKACSKCNENADCVKGKCRCKEGFVGNGEECKVNPCLFCNENASCNKDTCICNIGYLGDGLQCKRFDDHCGRCSPSADCIDGFCFCRPGYYGNGNDCWPNTDSML